MLKKIPSILPPYLIKIMMEMGHGDELVLADGNYPSAELGRRIVRMDGHNIPEILTALLKFFPLDPMTEKPVMLMKVPDGANVETPIWDEYKNIIAKSEEAKAIEKGFSNIEQYDFYDRTKKAYVIIATSEPALYANIILKKGIVVE